jgi:hypothetical protein
MTLIKVLLNSILSTENVQCVILDMKDFYLSTPMKRFEYMRLRLNDIPELKRVPLSIATWRSQMVCLSLPAGIPGLELPENLVRGLLLSPNVQPPSWAFLFSS